MLLNAFVMTIKKKSWHTKENSRFYNSSIIKILCGLLKFLMMNSDMRFTKLWSMSKAKKFLMRLLNLEVIQKKSLSFSTDKYSKEFPTSMKTMFVTEILNLLISL